MLDCRNKEGVIEMFESENESSIIEEESLITSEIDSE